MIQLRKMEQTDLPVFKKWLYTLHVAMWYHDPLDWIKEVEFAGKLNRSASIEPILDVIRSTHKINVNTRGKTIIFSAKQ